MDACYYSLIRRSADGSLVGWIPDLPGVAAAGPVEQEVIRCLSRDAGKLLRAMAAKGLPFPAPSASDGLPLGDACGRYRRLLLVLRTGEEPPV